MRATKSRLYRILLLTRFILIASSSSSSTSLAFIVSKSSSSSSSNSDGDIIDPKFFELEHQVEEEQQHKTIMIPQRTAAGIVSRNNGRTTSTFVKGASASIVIQHQQQQKQYHPPYRFPHHVNPIVCNTAAAAVTSSSSASGRVAIATTRSSTTLVQPKNEQANNNSYNKNENSSSSQKRKYLRNDGGCTSSSPTSTLLSPGEQQEQQPPILLLEGEDFFVSHDGISRTFYELTSAATTANAIPALSKFAIEEYYNLGTAQKTFILRKSADKPIQRSYYHQPNSVDLVFGQGFSPVGAQNDDKEEGGVLQLATLFPKVPSQSPIQIQEIDQGVFGSAGTGSTTWESSIAMALFFSQNPHLLHGDVLELGSGVGLGGILTQLMPSLPIIMTDDDDDHGKIQSMTLTDHNPEVIQQCRKNILENIPHNNNNPFLNVCYLDWYEPHNIAHSARNSNNNQKNDNNNKKSNNKKFDTIIACDCAYRHKDAEALAHTMTTLLQQQGNNKNNNSKIHIFGPYNRSAMYELIKILEEEYDMNVLLDFVALKRYRLKPPTTTTNKQQQQQQKQPPFYWQQQQQQQQQQASFVLEEEEEYECPYASKSTAKFLHITVSHSNNHHDNGQHKKKKKSNDPSSGSNHTTSSSSSSFHSNTHENNNNNNNMADID